MEKTLIIDGKKVHFKTSGSVPIRYKKQFGKDFFTEIASMSAGKKVNLEKLDFEVFYNLAWIFAKIADKTIPEPLEWLDTFEVFPIVDILPELQEMIIDTMKTKKK